MHSHDEEIAGRESPGGQDDSLTFDLARLLTSRDAKELADVRSELEKMATTAKTPVTRELGFVALVAADTDVERAWKLGTKSVTALQDLVNAMPLLREPASSS